MRIFIPTYGRSDRQKTFNNLPESITDRTKLVVQEREANLYPYYPTVLLPDHIRDIAATRDWIVEQNPNQHVIMLDDDLDFATRRLDEPTKFLPATQAEVEEMFEQLDYRLRNYPHVSVAGREGANYDTGDLRYNDRCMRILGYDTAVLQKHDILFGPGTFMCDFYVTLQLLTLGYENCVLNWIVQNQGGSNAKGGCSTQRTPEAQTQAAEFLKEIFPEYVTLVKKQTKTSWGGKERTDVRIAWKRAIRAGTVARLDRRARGNPPAEGGGPAQAVE